MPGRPNAFRRPLVSALVVDEPRRALLSARANSVLIHANRGQRRLLGAFAAAGVGLKVGGTLEEPRLAGFARPLHFLGAVGRGDVWDDCVHPGSRACLRRIAPAI
jgi:hypothetical protein